MAKFHVNATVSITRVMSYEVTVTAGVVIEEFGLEGEDRADWREYIEDYLIVDLEAYLDDDLGYVAEGDHDYRDSRETIGWAELDTVEEVVQATA